ncbi:hypothetical protein ACFL0S_13170 [Thermodesulfobacteriota bacterium]
MRKKSIFMSLALFSVILGFAVVAAAQPITLTFANQNPDTSWSGMKAIAPWAKQVEEATNGKVKIQIFYSQTAPKHSQKAKMPGRPPKMESPTSPGASMATGRD